MKILIGSLNGTTAEAWLNDEMRARRVGFMVLNDGRIYFEGSAADLLASRDDYLQEFLFMTLPPW